MLRAGVDVSGLCWIKGSAAADAGKGVWSLSKTGSADVQPAAKNWSILTRTYGPPYSTLPRVPAVPHAIFWWAPVLIATVRTWSPIEHAVYKLYCSCGKPPFSRNGSELRPYAVSNCAHDRGYGSPQEIVDISNNSKSVDGTPLD